MGKRALIVIRLSRVTDATTSPERPLDACRELCEQRGYEVVGVAEDLDVSAGATTPFNRPKLGPWLANRHNEFDVLVMYRMDRLVRRLLDLADVIRRRGTIYLLGREDPYASASPLMTAVAGEAADG